jgi:microcystin degradation protein MlrC
MKSDPRMRIAVGGISHEALTFTPGRATLDDFRILRGAEVLGFPGLSAAVDALGFEPVPTLLGLSRCPYGVVEADAYRALRDEMLDGLRRAGDLDGVCLILHGAMLVDGVGSGETDQVRAVRAVVGRGMPLAARLDPHGTVTEEFARLVDTWAAYRTAPHRDQAETLGRALGLLARCVGERLRPRPVFVRVPLLLPGEKATTDVEPMRSLLADARGVEAMPGILNAEVMIGFGWADSPHSTSSIAVVAADPAHLPLAGREARRLAQAMWDRRHQFAFDQEVAPSADEAIRRAVAAPESTIFLTDSGDNPTAGAPGDVPLFLSRLLALRVPDAVLAGIPDAEAVRACRAAGVRGTVTVDVGGKLDPAHGGPLRVTGVVEHLYAPVGTDEGGLATLRVDGVHVILTERRQHFARLDDFRRAGIDPLRHKVVVVKLGYLMAELRDAAPREILVLTPGCADMELSRLPFRHVRRPIFPLDPDFAWEPVVADG